MPGKNAMGYTKEQWKALSKKERRKESFQLFKRNVLPAFLGGSLGASLLSKDPQFKKLGTIVTSIALVGAATKFDPTDFTGSFEALKKQGANLLNFKKLLTNDQKNGLRILGEQGVVKSKLSFTGEGSAKIDTENGEDYEVEYDGWGQITNEIAEAKGLPEKTALEVAKLVAAQPKSKESQVKVFLKKFWSGVYSNLPQIISDMQRSGLNVPPQDDEIYNDTWVGEDDLLPENEKEPENYKKIFGIPQNTVIGGLGLAAIGYAVLKK